MDKLTDYFQRIYVINLPDRRDRLKSIRRELDKASLILGSPGVELISATRYHEACGFPSPSVRGCFLSHLSILKKARDLKLRNVLIMEDDLFISPLLQTHLAEIMKGVSSQPWGFLYFGHIEELETKGPPTMTRHDGPLITAHFYAVNQTIFDRLIRYLEDVQTRPAGSAFGGPMHYDGALSMFRAGNPDVLTLIAKPNLGWQRPSRSDIHSRWFDRIPGLRQAAAMARSLRLYMTESASHESPSQPTVGKQEKSNTIEMPLQSERENKATATASQ